MNAQLEVIKCTASFILLLLRTETACLIGKPSASAAMLGPSPATAPPVRPPKSAWPLSVTTKPAHQAHLAGLHSIANSPDSLDISSLGPCMGHPNTVGYHNVQIEGSGVWNRLKCYMNILQINQQSKPARTTFYEKATTHFYPLQFTSSTHESVR